MDGSQLTAPNAPHPVEERLERWSRHPVGIVVRFLIGAAATFFGGLMIVVGVFGYNFKRPDDALWTDRFVESAFIGATGTAIVLAILVAIWRPTRRKLLAVAVVLVAAPLIGRAI